MNKESIEQLLRQLLEEQHWQLRRVFGFPPLFMRQLTVSPFYLPRIVRRSSDLYFVDGYIGMIHQKFEQLWGSLTNYKTERNSFALALNTANISAVANRAYIHSCDFDSDIRELCLAVANMLERLPHDELSLRSSFEHFNLGGISLDKFGPPLASENKFNKLKTFVLSAPNP